MVTATLVASLALFSSDVVVRYYNQAKISSPALKTAVQTADSVFRKSHLDLKWVDCLGEYPKPCDLALAGFDVLLVAGKAPNRVGRHLPLGHAVLTPGGIGRYARIYLPQVEEYAISIDVPVSVVLGYTVAHEIGHLLLADGRHSPTGLMKAVWNRSDRHLISGGRFSFHPKEAQKIRLRMLELSSNSGTRAGASNIKTVNPLAEVISKFFWQ
jgi:hypothetical protein